MYKSTLPLLATLTLLAAPATVEAGGGPLTDKDKIKFDLQLGIGGGKEMLIREPGMCAGGASAKIKWNKSKDKLTVKLKADGMPYEPSYCFDENIDTPYNVYPMCVENGAWQMWLVTRFFNKPTTYYYDSVTGLLIDNEFDLLQNGGPPPGAIPIELLSAQMVCSPYYQPDPVTNKVNEKFQFDYHNVLDALGSPGTLVGIVPFDLNDEDSFWLHYTEELLPMGEAQSWDTTIADINSGTGATVVSTSVEPVPKPLTLLTHDQLMIGFTGAHPSPFLQPLPPEAFDNPDCGTEQIDVPFPGGEIPGG